MATLGLGGLALCVGQGLIGDDHLNHVVHHVLGGDGLLANQAHRGGELLLRQAVHHEHGALTHLHIIDVGLTDVDLDLHLGEVLGDLEKVRCAEAGGHGLAHIRQTGDDHTVHGGGDVAVGQVGLGAVEGGLGVLVAGLRRLEGHLLGLQVLVRQQLLGKQALGTLVLAAGIIHVGLGPVHAGLGVLQLGLPDGRIDLGNQLALLHDAVVVGVEGRDHTRHLGAHRHLHHRADSPGGVDALGDVAAVHLGLPPLHLVLGTGEDIGCAPCDQSDADSNNDPSVPFHEAALHMSRGRTGPAFNLRITMYRLPLLV